MRETKITTQPRGGGDEIEELPAEIVRYGYRLNRPGGIEFSLDLNHEKCRKEIIGAGLHEVVITVNGQREWVGPVLTADESESQKTVSFGGEGLMSYLRRWHITDTLEFVQEDQFEIARELIRHHQAKAYGDFNIDVSGSEMSGRLRDRTYSRWDVKNVFEAFVQLSEVQDGFDFEFNSRTRAVDFYYPNRGRPTEHVFDDRNIRMFSRQEDATEQASEVIAVGAGEGDEMLIHAEELVESLEIYGRTQRVYTNKDVSIQETIARHGQRELDFFKVPPNTISIVTGGEDPPIGAVAPGDLITVRWESPYSPVNVQLRSIGYDITWSQSEETVTHYLEVTS